MVWSLVWVREGGWAGNSLSGLQRISSLENLSKNLCEHNACILGEMKVTQLGEARTARIGEL